ncbi:MAG: hypothetical protein ABIH65_01555 [Nanoarchaeota archaeon]
MEKRSKQITAPDFEKYQYGALAARLYNSKESNMYAPSALEVLAGKDGLNLGEEALGFIRGTQASDKGIQTAIGVYAGQFEQKRGQYNLSELLNKWYSPVLAGLDKTDIDKIRSKLGESKETYAEINEKYIEAEHVIEGIKKGIKTSEEKIADAIKTLQKYEEIKKIVDILDDYKFESLRTKAVDVSRIQDLKGLASRITMPEKKKAR